MNSRIAPLGNVLLGSAMLGLVACGPERPANAIVEDFGCFDLQHVAGSYEGGQAKFGEIIVRGESSSDCPHLAKLAFALFADANGNSEPDEGELLLAASKTYSAFTTSARFYAISKVTERGDGPLRYRVTLTDSNGEDFVNQGPCPD